MDLAAALLKMSMGDESEDIIDSFETARSLDELDSFGRGSSRGRGRERSSYGNRTAREQQTALLWITCWAKGMMKMARLFINIGKAQRITPGDILGAVARESREFRDAWWEALTCMTGIPSWMCPDAMRTMC